MARQAPYTRHAGGGITVQDFCVSSGLVRFGEMKIISGYAMGQVSAAMLKVGHVGLDQIMPNLLSGRVRPGQAKQKICLG